MPRGAILSFKSTAADSGRILLGSRCVAEIRELALVKFVPWAGAVSLVGRDVGVPLLWQQYGNHQDPERSARYHRRLSLQKAGPGWLRLRAVGSTQSRSMTSTFELTFRVDARQRLSLHAAARLEVDPGDGWLVTPHADHGEVTFCTLWPTGVFSPDGRAPKRFQCCLASRGTKMRRIEHHHLESPDKHRIALRAGDRFAWALEDINPVLTIGPGAPVLAGLCAYMWDAHFGLRTCPDHEPVTLPPGTVLTADYTLAAVARAELEPDCKRAQLLSPGRAADTPVWTGGLHTFKETFRSADIDRNTAWPWATAITAGSADDVELARERWFGSSECFSLRIHHRAKAASMWLASTLGPAFGEPPFRRGGKLFLRALVFTRGLRGTVRVALRVHRQGRGSVFDVAGYEVFPSATLNTDEGQWTELRLTTPALAPAPDRVHVLLELDGEGRVWFDDVQFLRLD